MNFGRMEKLRVKGRKVVKNGKVKRRMEGESRYFNRKRRKKETERDTRTETEKSLPDFFSSSFHIK